MCAPGEVLVTEQESMRTQATQEECAKISSSLDLRTDISKAFFNRVQGVAGGKNNPEMARGIRRVDFLGKSHYFAGLGPVAGDVGRRWKLLVRERVDG